MRLPFLCEKSGAIALAGRQAGRQAGMQAAKQAGRQSDKIVRNLEIFKIIYWMKYSRFLYV